MARRLLGLVVALSVLGAVVGVAGVGGVTSDRHVDARSGLVRTGIATRPHVTAPPPAVSVALRRQLRRLVRGVRGLSQRGAGASRIAHAPSVTVPPVPSLSCPVRGPGCSLHPCVLFAGNGRVILRLQTAVLVERLARANRRVRHRTVVAIAPTAARRGGHLIGCRRLRAGALSIS